MKKLARMLALPLAVVYLFVIFSCNSNSEKLENQELMAKSIENSNKAVELYFNLKKTFANNTSYSRSGLTQETIDEYLVNAGLEAGSITLSTVNTIISEISDNNSLNFDEKINSLDFLAFVKNKLIEMKNNGHIIGIENTIGFNNLTVTEKEILLNSNNLISAFERAQSNTDIPCPGEPCTGALMLLGYGIGSAICPPCGLVGAVIGLIFGTSLKD